MTDLPDWAKDRAREFFNDPEDCPHLPTESGPGKQVYYKANCPDCLAALLLEVKISGEARIAAEQAGEYARGCANTLAEVRSVVEEVRTKWGVSHSVATLPCTEILSRLDALK